MNNRQLNTGLFNSGAVGDQMFILPPVYATIQLQSEDRTTGISAECRTNTIPSQLPIIVPDEIEGVNSPW